MTDAGRRPTRRRRLLLLSMYPLDQGSWGPTVRIRHLRDELAALVRLDVVSGDRSGRRRALARYVTAGRLRGLDGIYVESSSFLPAEADLATLALARGLKIPVLTYVRDAYQRFPDEYPPATCRARVGAALFGPALRALDAVSTRLAFPTRGLARAVLGAAGASAPLLPPGAPHPVTVARSETADRLLFVGDARLPAHGVDRLVAAVSRAREAGAEVALTVVCRPGHEPTGVTADWLTIERAEGAGLHALLPDVLATVVPRPRTAYNDLALPVKLFEYLAFGRPVLVTNCAEQARLVGDAAAGLVVGDSVEEQAEGIIRLRRAEPKQLDAWSAAAHRAAVANRWAVRAQEVLDLLASSRS